MARIRNIKPDLFDDPGICELSAEAALVFIGLWTQADRAGRLVDEPKRLKIRLRPLSKCDMDAILGELHDANFIIRYQVGAQRLIQVRSFEKHQRPHKDEKASQLPPISCETGLPPWEPGDFPAKTPETEMEMETETEMETGMELVAMRPPDAEALREAWNRLTTPPLPKCLALSKGRITHAKARLAERPLSEWEFIIQRINASSFCRGETDRGNWVASFDFLLRPETGLKALEGAYDNRRGPRAIEAQPKPPEVDWFEECKRIHNGECELNRSRHNQRIKTDAWLASQRASA